MNHLKKKKRDMTNMCFMKIDELDEVKFNISYDDIHDAFEELYEDFEKLGLKNTSLKKKVQQLGKELREVKEKFSNVKDSKTYLEKYDKILRKKNEWLTSSLSIFSYGQKSFEMILVSQKCILINKGQDSNLEDSKTCLEKENEILRKKNEWLTSSLSIFSCE